MGRNILSAVLVFISACRATPPEEVMNLTTAEEAEEIAYLNAFFDSCKDDVAEHTIGASWVVADIIMRPKDFVLPSLVVCGTPTGMPVHEVIIGIVDLGGQSWIAELPDARLMVDSDMYSDTHEEGDTPYGYTDYSAYWQIDLRDYVISVSDEVYFVIDLNLLVFDNDELLAEIDDIWDDEDDELLLGADITGFTPGHLHTAFLRNLPLTLTTE